MGAARQAFVSAGANLGDRLATLRRARDDLRATAGIMGLTSSSIFETEPVGVLDQPRFLNLVFALQTDLTPEQLLGVLQRIETEHGRVRAERWGPRTLDLDLLAYDGETRATATLTLPHPRMFQRAFVLVPLHDLFARDAALALAAPDLHAAVARVTISSDGVRRCDAIL